MNLSAILYPVKLFHWYRKAAAASLRTDYHGKVLWEDVYKPELCFVGKLIVLFLRRGRG